VLIVNVVTQTVLVFSFSFNHAVRPGVKCNTLVPVSVHAWKLTPATMTPHHPGIRPGTTPARSGTHHPGSQAVWLCDSSSSYLQQDWINFGATYDYHAKIQGTGSQTVIY